MGKVKNSSLLSSIVFYMYAYLSIRVSYTSSDETVILTSTYMIWTEIPRLTNEIKSFTAWPGCVCLINSCSLKYKNNFNLLVAYI